MDLREQIQEAERKFIQAIVKKGKSSTSIRFTNAGPGANETRIIEAESKNTLYTWKSPDARTCFKRELQAGQERIVLSSKGLYLSRTVGLGPSRDPAADEDYLAALTVFIELMKT